MNRFWAVVACVAIGFGVTVFVSYVNAEKAKQEKPAAERDVVQPEPAEKVCSVPVIIRLEDKKIVVEPDPAFLYWGMGAVFEVHAGEGEMVEIILEKDPFRESHEPGTYRIEGEGKLKTAKSFRPVDFGEIGKTLAEKRKRAIKFKYSVKWSGGRAEKGVEIDPIFWIGDNW